MKLSAFGEKFAGESGITSLMDDLGNALASQQDMIMMGGGNPSLIPEVQDIFRQRMQEIINQPTMLDRFIGLYDPPQGEKEFISELAKLLHNQFGWNITADNICLTNGSQSAFFMLFNMFGGAFSDGSKKQIQLPLAPEYIGYADAGISSDLFTAGHPNIEYLDDHVFKYHVDFNDITIDDHIGAICVSRPTNPTGNVLTDDEVAKLDQLAKDHNIPLIIDNAYGTPFPNLIFTKAEPIWNENIILSMSLSKLGLPATRTGIVVANEEVINALTTTNAIMNLSPGSAGSLLALDLVKSGDIMRLSENTIRPYYENKANQAVAWVHQDFSGCPYYIHKPEGAMFLWLWFKNLPITSLELYERLKQRGVLIVSGHYFFPGINDPDWRHQHECIRLTYSQDATSVKKGISIIAEEVKKTYEGQ